MASAVRMALVPAAARTMEVPKAGSVRRAAMSVIGSSAGSSGPERPREAPRDTRVFRKRLEPVHRALNVLARPVGVACGGHGFVRQQNVAAEPEGRAK
jgi:hypothetical protein